MRRTDFVRTPVDTVAQKNPGLLASKTREKVDAWCERGILGLVLAILIFGPLGLGAVRTSEFLVIQFLTAGVLLLWLVRYWFGKTHRLLWAPICWLIPLFLAYAVWRYLAADIEYVARQELIRVVLYAALFFAILNNLHRQQPTRIIALTLIGLGTLIALYALYQWLAESEHVLWFLKPRAYFRRASGTYICPNHLAGFLGMLMPIALAYTLAGRFQPVARVHLGYAALVMMAGIAVTLSRGGWLAVAVGLLVFFVCILRQRSYRLIGAVCLLIIGLAGAVFYFKSARTQQRLSDTQVTGYERNIRLRIWPAAWRMWQDHPWTGVGPGHFDYRYRAYRDAHDKLQMRPGRVHNDYLNTLTDWGVIGTILVALPWLALFGGVWWGWRFIRRRPSDLSQKKSNKSAFVLGASIGLLVLLVHAFVDFNMHIPANAITAVTLMALVTGHLRFASDRFWVTQRVVGRILGTIVLGAVMVGLVWQGIRAAREYHWLRQARRLKDDPVARLQALGQAFVVEPKNFETAYDIGEILRQQSWQGDEAYRALAEKAADWFQRSLALNPHHAYSYMRIGMCEHWLGRHDAAGEWFQRAVKLDPHGYFMLAHMGWHYFQLEQYDKAREWFLKSLGLNWVDNPIARNYLRLTEEKLAEQKKGPKS